MQSKATSAGVGQRPEMKDGAVETPSVKIQPPLLKTKKNMCTLRPHQPSTAKSPSAILINGDGCHGDWSPYSLSAVFSQMGPNVCLLMEQ